MAGVLCLLVMATAFIMCRWLASHVQFACSSWQSSGSEAHTPALACTWYVSDLFCGGVALGVCVLLVCWCGVSALDRHKQQQAGNSRENADRHSSMGSAKQCAHRL